MKKLLQLFHDGVARSMFFRCLAVCLCALLLAVGLLMPIRSELYRANYESVIAESEERLAAGMDWFDSADMMMSTSSEMLCGMSDYTRLRRHIGAGTASLAVPIQRVQKYLLRIMLMCDNYIKGIYVLFQENDLFISDFSSALDYKEMYPTFFRYEGMDAETWKNECARREKTGLRIMPSASCSSGYGFDFRCVTCVVHSVAERYNNMPGAVCFMLDEGALMRTFAGSELYERGRIELMNQQGTLLAAHGEPTSDTRDVQLTRVSADHSLCVRIIIPSTIILSKIQMLTGIILAYVYLGLFCLVLLVGGVITMYYVRAYRIVRISSQHTGELFRQYRQHDYVDSAIRTIIQSKDSAERRVTLLQNTWDNETLLSVCTRGILTSSERSKAQQLLGEVSVSFAIALVEILGEQTEENRAVWAEEYLRADEPSGLSLFPNDTTVAFITPIHAMSDHARLLDKISRLNNLCRLQFSALMHAGISEMHAGVEELHIAYDQARLALRMHRLETEAPYMVYGRDVMGKDEPYISANMLSKLTDLLVMGESEEISRLFDEITTIGYGEDDSMYRYMYVFSAVRMAMLSASRVIVRNEEYHLPDYLADESIAEAFRRQKESAMELCRLACERRRSNNTALLNSIVEYIAFNFTDPNLSADQIAQHFSLSRSYVLQFVQMQTGKTLNDYIEGVRLEYVEQYLIGTNWSMERIMEATGYVSQNTMYRAFKKKHGVTPGKWRENYG